MKPAQLNNEPYEISVRFYDALRAKALRLETDAQQDELVAASLEHPGHFERQKLLIQRQREDAARLRSFLARTRIRSK
jgi:hypothetical protein